jgi:hypothetical protein
MDFPHDWTVLAAEEFEMVTPRFNGNVTMEVFAQLRPSGRILDNFRVALAGSKALEFDTDLFSLIPAAVFKGWRVKGQCWARDVAICSNVFSSGWIDLVATIAMRQLDAFDKPQARSGGGGGQQTSPPNPEPSGLGGVSLRKSSPKRVSHSMML